MARHRTWPNLREGKGREGKGREGAFSLCDWLLFPPGGNKRSSVSKWAQYTRQVTFRSQILIPVFSREALIINRSILIAPLTVASVISYQ